MCCLSADLGSSSVSAKYKAPFSCGALSPSQLTVCVSLYPLSPLPISNYQVLEENPVSPLSYPTPLVNHTDRCNTNILPVSLTAHPRPGAAPPRSGASCPRGGAQPPSSTFSHPQKLSRANLLNQTHILLGVAN